MNRPGACVACGYPATREVLDAQTGQPIGVLLCTPGARDHGWHHTRAIPSTAGPVARVPELAVAAAAEASGRGRGLRRSLLARASST